MPNVGNVFGNEADTRKFKPSDKLVLPTCYVGVEAELERVDNKILRGLWLTKTDGSLHDSGLEYVFSNPLYGEDILDALDELEAAFDASSVSTGEDTSLHVHIDVRDMTPVQLNRMILLYIIFEKLLFNYCAPERESNIFCLSTEYAQSVVTDYARLSQAALNNDADSIRNIVNEQQRYSAMNLASIATFGSIEFRGHRGEYRKEPILNWINILLSIKKAALNDDYPEDKPYLRLKQIGAGPFCREVFGEHFDLLNNDDVHNQLFTGLQLARRVANFFAEPINLYSMNINGGSNLHRQLQRKRRTGNTANNLPSIEETRLTAYNYSILQNVWDTAMVIGVEGNHVVEHIRRYRYFFEVLLQLPEDQYHVYYTMALNEGFDYAHDVMLETLDTTSAFGIEEDLEDIDDDLVLTVEVV